MRSFDFILPSFFLFAVAACNSPAEKTNVLSDWQNEPTIQTVSLADTIPYKYLSQLNITEINGVKVSYPSRKSTCYFQYQARSADVLRMIAALPFKPDQTDSDTLSRKMDFPFSLAGKESLPDKEIKASSFFWELNPAEFDYYECRKSPVRHTILIHKSSGIILHRMEFSS